MKTKNLRLKKQEHRRIRAGHPWIFSNEINTAITPLKSFQPGDQVIVEAHDETALGAAYVNPHSLICARLYSTDPKQLLDLNFFIEKINLALAVRTQLFSAPYYRLIFGESDQIPGLVIDRFGEHLTVQINTAGMERCKELIVQALLSCIPETQSILFKNDSSIRTQEGLVSEVIAAYGEPPETVTIEENNARFIAPLMSGQKTGWFYDHRQNRLRLQDYVKNRHVLDVFSYVGAWGIQAALYGAASVEFVDSSQQAINAVKENVKLNQLTTRLTTVCEDAFVVLKEYVQKRQTFNVIILDPPAFVKKAKDKAEGLLAYHRINELALKMLTPGGILISCSCSMQVSMQDLIDILQRISAKNQIPIQLLERGHQGPDHPLHLAIPETDYLKALFIRKMTV